MKVNFESTDEELALIEKIVERAENVGYVRGRKSRSHWYTKTTMTLDLLAANANGNPMDFERMLATDDLNFLHDVAGIARHMNRETGKFNDFFSPRFTKHEMAHA
jgi:hypothetical protein